MSNYDKNANKLNENRGMPQQQDNLQMPVNEPNGQEIYRGINKLKEDRGMPQYVNS